MKAKEAKQTKIWVMENGLPTETNLYDFVMESAEQTTSPRGVCNKLHIREIERDCSCLDDEGCFDALCKKCYKGCELVYQVWDWGFRVQYPREVETFETEEEAEDFIYTRTYDYDFSNEINRDTRYFNTPIELVAEIFELSEETATSYYNHMLKAEAIKADREAQYRREVDAKMKRVAELANIYAAMVDRVEGESQKDCEQRLSRAIGERIEKAVFYKAVSILRSK